MNTMELLTVALLAAWSAPRCAGAECACEEGWTGAGERGMCYAAFDGPLVPDGAVGACADKGGTLASIADRAEYDAVRELHGQRAAAMHIGLRLADGQWANPDGADSGYVTTSWSPGEPRGAGKHHCAAIIGQDWKMVRNGEGARVLVVGLLNDIPCDRYDSAFACSKAAECAAGCPEGWTAAGERGMCYQAFDGPLKHDAATAACGEAGGTLASIADAAEHAAVVALVQATKEQVDALNWDAHMALVGLKKGGGQWANPDGADATFVLTQWNEKSEEPRGDGDCVEIIGKASDKLAYTWTEGSLNDLACNSEARPYVCSMAAA